MFASTSVEHAVCKQEGTQPTTFVRLCASSLL